MIAIIDYGMGNLKSVKKALDFLGFEAKITSEKKDILDASHVILPGVGAFADAMSNLNKRGLITPIKKSIDSGKPFLGICLGMQLLFDYSLEYGRSEGLKVVSGGVEHFSLTDKKVPHMGWNSLKVHDNPIIPKEENLYVYFVHSYHAVNVPEENVIATTEYGYEFVSAVSKGNVFGLQFHPEKSAGKGLNMLRRFGGLK
ncbi:MAG: imidazole glycerol phosphate synthase subunit HisH [Eubacteriales bacterium]